MPELPADSNEEMLAHYRRRQSRLYRILRAPVPLVHNPKERLLPPADGIGLLIGGAWAQKWHGFFTVDLDAYPGVDVAADVHALPFRDNSVAAIECDAVLEHVRNPVLAVAEIVRVLKPGGYIHAVVPFNQPFHAYPSDFQRWTIPGLEELLTTARCDVVESGIRTGPTATMLAYFCEYCRILAPASMGKVAYAAANWFVWPLRYLDVWLNRNRMPTSWPTPSTSSRGNVKRREEPDLCHWGVRELCGVKTRLRSENVPHRGAEAPYYPRKLKRRTTDSSNKI